MKRTISHQARQKRRLIPLIGILMLLIAGTVVWLCLRNGLRVGVTEWAKPARASYGADPGERADMNAEPDKVFTAMALCTLSYGCESIDAPSGTVADMVAGGKMGIITENADVKRQDPADAATALIDTAAFILRYAGDMRFVTDLKDEKSGFYGAVFADDARRTLWIAYAGSITFSDALASVGLVLKPNLTRQEKQAFELYETTLQTDEIKELDYDLLLTGHSLGGALATMVARLTGCSAVTVSGADGLAMKKISACAQNSASDAVPATFRVENFLTSPDNGYFSVMDIVQRMMFWGGSDGVTSYVYPDNGQVNNAHAIFGFVTFEDGDAQKPALPPAIQ